MSATDPAEPRPACTLRAERLNGNRNRRVTLPLSEPTTVHSFISEVKQDEVKVGFREKKDVGKF